MVLIGTFLISLSFVFASRLPIVGGDNSTWGTVLNEFLSRIAGANATELNLTMVNGTNIYSSSINTTHIINGAINDEDISDAINLTIGERITFSFGEIIDNIVNGWIRTNGSLNVTENIESGGNISASNLFGFINWSYIQNYPSTLISLFIQGTVGNTLGAIINNVDNHTQNSNNIIFAVIGNGTSNVMMPHFWIQNGAGGQASGISRSFMIVNENPTQQNTTNITSCSNYAVYAGKSLYIDCNTTTTGADLLVGDDMQVMGDTFTENTNVTGLLTTGNIVVNGNVSIKRPYGMFSSTETQVMTAANTAYPITFNWTENAYEIIKASDNSNFSVQQTGNYLIELSAITDTDTVNKHIDIWAQKNGANIPRSNTKVQLPSANTKTLIVVPFIIDLNTSDSFRLMMNSDDAGSQLLYVAGSGSGANAVPETPSIIMTITKLSELTS